MIIIELPIYYTFTKKTKKDNKVLVGMNWYRNAHFRSSNQVKQHYHKLIYSKVTQSQKLKDKYMVSYMLYPSNSSCDLMNVVSVIDKFLNDALQDCGASLALIKITKSPYLGKLESKMKTGLALIKITKSPYRKP